MDTDYNPNIDQAQDEYDQAFKDYVDANLESLCIELEDEVEYECRNHEERMEEWKRGEPMEEFIDLAKERFESLK